MLILAIIVPENKKGFSISTLIIRVVKGLMVVFKYPHEGSITHIPAFEVTGSSSQQDIVGMPVQTEDGGTDRLLDVLAYPPIGDNTAC